MSARPPIDVTPTVIEDDVIEAPRSPSPMDVPIPSFQMRSYYAVPPGSLNDGGIPPLSPRNVMVSFLIFPPFPNGCDGH